MSTNLAPVFPPPVGSFTAAIDLTSLDLGIDSQLMVGILGGDATEIWCPYFALNNALAPTPGNLAGLVPAPNVALNSSGQPCLGGPTGGAGPFSIPFGPNNPAPGAYLFLLRLAGSAPVTGVQISGQA